MEFDKVGSINLEEDTNSDSCLIDHKRVLGHSTLNSKFVNLLSLTQTLTGGSK